MAWPAFLLFAPLSGCVTAPEPPTPEGVHEWPFASGTIDGRRASEDPRITATTLATLGAAWTFSTKGAVTGTPTVKDGLVYAATWKGSVVALHVASGTMAWSRDFGTRITGSVTVHDGLALFGDNQARLHAVNAATGADAWNRTLDDKLNAHLYATPLIVPANADRKPVVIQAIGSDQESLTIHGKNPVDFRGSIVALDLATGDELWRTWLSPEGLFGAPVWGTPVLVPALDLVVFGTGNAYVAPAGPMTDAIVALKLSDGSVAWSYQATPNDVFTHLNPVSPDDDFGSTPSIVHHNGTSLVVIGQKSSLVWAIDAATGKLAWKQGRGEDGEGIIGDTAANDGLVYAPYVTLKQVAALDQGSGAPKWTHPLEGLGFADPVAVPGAVIVADTSGIVAALEANSGRVVWNASVGEGGVYGGLSVADGHLFVPVVRGEFLGDAGAVIAFAPGRGAAPRTSTSEPIPGEVPGEVAMRDFEFVPGVQTIQVGENVTWINEDAVLHTVTFDGANATVYPEQEVQPGTSARIVFPEPGTFAYYCRPHAAETDGTWTGMTGSVVVLPADP